MGENVGEMTAPTPAAPADEPESVTQLVGDLASEVATLVRQELAHAAVELDLKARIAVRSALLVVAGVQLAAVSALVLVGATVLGLGRAIPMWAAAAAIAVLLGAAAFAAVRIGAARLRALTLVPTETFASLREDSQLMKQEVGATREQLATTMAAVRRRIARAAKARPRPRVKPKRAPARRKDTP